MIKYSYLSKHILPKKNFAANWRLLFYISFGLLVIISVIVWQIDLIKIRKNSNAQVLEIETQSETNLNNYLEKSAKSGIELTILGKKLLDTEQFSNSIIFFQQASKKDPNYYPTQLYLGYAYLKLNSYDSALSAFKAAAQINPLSSEAQNYLAYTYNKLGDTSNAQICYNKAKELEKLVSGL